MTLVEQAPERGVVRRAWPATGPACAGISWCERVAPLSNPEWASGLHGLHGTVSHLPRPGLLWLPSHPPPAEKCSAVTAYLVVSHQLAPSAPDLSSKYVAAAITASISALQFAASPTGPSDAPPKASEAVAIHLLHRCCRRGRCRHWTRTGRPVPIHL